MADMWQRAMADIGKVRYNPFRGPRPYTPVRPYRWVRAQMEMFWRFHHALRVTETFRHDPDAWNYMLDLLGENLIAGGYLLVKKTSPNPGATSYAHKTGAGEATT